MPARLTEARRCPTCRSTDKDPTDQIVEHMPLQHYNCPDAWHDSQPTAATLAPEGTFTSWPAYPPKAAEPSTPAAQEEWEFERAVKAGHIFHPAGDPWCMDLRAAHRRAVSAARAEGYERGRIAERDKVNDDWEARHPGQRRQ